MYFFKISNNFQRISDENASEHSHLYRLGAKLKTNYELKQWYGNGSWPPALLQITTVQSKAGSKSLTIQICFLDCLKIVYLLSVFFFLNLTMNRLHLCTGRFPVWLDPAKTSPVWKLFISCRPSFWIYAILWMPKWAHVASGTISQTIPDDPTWKPAQTPRYLLPLAMDKPIYSLIIPSTPKDITFI